MGNEDFKEDVQTRLPSYLAPRNEMQGYVFQQPARGPLGVTEPVEFAGSLTNF